MENTELIERICLRELRSAFVDRSSDWRRANAERLICVANELTKIDAGYSFLMASLEQARNYKTKYI